MKSFSSYIFWGIVDIIRMFSLEKRKVGGEIYVSFLDIELVCVVVEGRSSVKE